MERRRPRKGIIAVAATSAAAAFAFASVIAPAIGGGTSLSKLSKQVKALQKQVAAIQAQPGPQGPPGQQGQSGAQGPSATRIDNEMFALAYSDVLATQDELTLSAYCDQPGGAGPSGQWLYAQSTVPGRISWSTTHEEQTGAVTSDTGTTQLPAGTSTFFFGNEAPYPSPSNARDQLHAVYRNADRVISIQLHLFSVWGQSCLAEGTMVPAG